MPHTVSSLRVRYLVYIMEDIYTYIYIVYNVCQECEVSPDPISLSHDIVNLEFGSGYVCVFGLYSGVKPSTPYTLE